MQANQPASQRARTRRRPRRRRRSKTGSATSEAPADETGRFAARRVARRGGGAAVRRGNLVRQSRALTGVRRRPGGSDSKHEGRAEATATAAMGNAAAGRAG
eukprot:356275-Chlamydomonas_euryale.AAC.9